MVVTAAKKPKPRTHMTAEDWAHEGALSLVEEQFRDLDVVWAKVDSYPWWPAVMFHSWDVARDVGLPTEEKKLPIPEPRRVPVLDASGAETGEVRVVSYCLVMFVDQFNFSVVELGPKAVVSYIPYFAKYRSAVLDCKAGSKTAKYKKRFKEALIKADGLLHMGEHSAEDLSLLETPKVEKPVKKRRTGSSLPPPSPLEDESFDDAWDDRESDEEGPEEADSDDDVYELPPGSKSRRGKTASDSESSEATSRKKSGGSASNAAKKASRGGGSLKGKGIVKRPVKVANGAASKRRSGKLSSSTADESDIFEAPRSLKTLRKKGKATENDPIDLTGTPESATKQQKGSAKAKSKRMKQSAVGDSPQDAESNRRVKSKNRGKKTDTEVEVADLTELADDDEDTDSTSSQEQDNRAIVMTPLSPIWTTKVDAAETNTDAGSRLAYKQDFVWDTSVFTDSDAKKDIVVGEDSSESSTTANGEANANGRERSLSKRQPRSVQQAQIRQNLMFGNLDPHTMVQCESYRQAGEEENTRSRGPSSLSPPFTVVVHPDATFVSDLHAHLATCEIIGFLGGKWDEATNTLFIQAAFPCRSLMIEGDDGSTDVEMDPGSEIELRGIINDAELEVVGWYHSHPAFAPDPSVRDIENQASYQQLFKRTQTLSGSSSVAEPFVGLIVGTYDTRRDTPVSLFRYFHVRGEKVSGGARREIYMPYEFIPARRHYRSVLNAEAIEKIRGLPVYPSVLKALRMPPRFRAASSVEPTTSSDEKGHAQVSPAVKASPPRRKPLASIRKRKQSADIGAMEAPAKRSRRGGKKRVADVPETGDRIDLTTDDADEAKARDEPDQPGIVDVVDVSGNDTEEATDTDVKTDDVSPDPVSVNEAAYTNGGDPIVIDDDAVSGNEGTGESATVEPITDRQSSLGSVDMSDLSVKSESGVELGDGELSTSVKQEEIAGSNEEAVAGSSLETVPLTITSEAVKTEHPNETESVSSAPQDSIGCSSDTAMKGADQVDALPADAIAEHKSTPTVNTDAPLVPTTHSSSGVSPPSASSSGRRRNRKPMHTNKTPWRSERSPKADGPRNTADNASSVGYYSALQLMDPNFSRNDLRSDPATQSKEADEKPEEEFAQLCPPLKDPEYFFIGDADAKASVDERKPIDADVSSTAVACTAVTTPTPTTGHCSTDDEIELVAVNEGNDPSGPNPSATIGQSVNAASEIPITEPVSETLDQLQSEVPAATEAAVAADDALPQVQARMNELVEEVVSDGDVSDKLAVKHEARGLPPVPSACDADAQDAAMDGPEPTHRTFVARVAMEISVDDTVASNGAVNGKNPGESLAVDAPVVAPTTNAVDMKTEQDAAATVVASTPGDESKPTPSDTACDDKNGVVMSELAENATTEDDTTVKVEKSESAREESVALAIPIVGNAMLFGRDRQYEDIRTSLEKMGEIMKRMQPSSAPATKPTPTSEEPSDSNTPPDVKPAEVKDEAGVQSVEETEDQHAGAVARRDAHLASLRTRYGPGMFGCVEQVVTLVDYYRDFERRIDLSEPWKAKMNKLRKIEASLSEYVQYLNLSVSLRRAFVEDLVGYLELSWELTRLER